MDGAVDALKVETARLDVRIDGVESELRAGFESVEARFESVDSRFEAMDAKFDALKGAFGTQGRYVFLVLALIAALGLYNAVAPKFPGARFPGERGAPARASPCGTGGANPGERSELADSSCGATANAL